MYSLVQLVGRFDSSTAWVCISEPDQQLAGTDVRTAILSQTFSHVFLRGLMRLMGNAICDSFHQPKLPPQARFFLGNPCKSPTGKEPLLLLIGT